MLKLVGLPLSGVVGTLATYEFYKYYENKQFHKYFPGGVTGDTEIKMKDGNFKKVIDITNNELLYTYDDYFGPNKISITKYTDRKFPVYVFDSYTGISPNIIKDKILNPISYVDEIYYLNVTSGGCPQIETKYYKYFPKSMPNNIKNNKYDIFYNLNKF